MPLIHTTISCPIPNSFRVQQIAGLFDVPLGERSCESFSVELPSLDEAWTIGVIVGPSGSGKSTVARAAYGDAVYQPHAWPADRAVIDGFGDAPTRQIAALLTAVGFSSPPSWIKPYWALSNGEQFRCDLARALLRAGGREPPESSAFPPLVVFDEFTSVVDRTVAKVGSAAVSKAIRGTPGADALRLAAAPAQFIAVTCHYDVVPWLEPDWVLDMAKRQLTWRRLRRPAIQLEVVRCRRSLWTRFERHHYLSGQLASGASCYAALWNDNSDSVSRDATAGSGARSGEPRSISVSRDATAGSGARSGEPTAEPRSAPVGRVAANGGAANVIALCATVGLYGRVGRKWITRIVVLPDYQGLGIGMQLAEHVAAYEAMRGFRVNLTASHPAVIAHCQRSAKWQAIGIKRAVTPSNQSSHGGYVKSAVGRSVVSFEFVPQPDAPARNAA